MSIFSDKLKLEVKSIYDSNLAQFASTKNDASIYMVPNDSISHYAIITSSSHSNVETSLKLHSEDTEVTTFLFDSNSINFGNDTLLKGNVIIYGSIITLGYDVLTEENKFILHNYGSSAQKGLNSVTQKTLTYMNDLSSGTSNAIISYMQSNLENMEIILGISNMTSLQNTYFTSNDFNNLFAIKSLDDIDAGTSNKYIANNEYHARNALIMNGKLVTSNLVVNSICIDGHVFAERFTGDGSEITNVNAELFNTNNLTETLGSSNLYFTSERVGSIANIHNEHTSNYMVNISNLYLDSLTYQDKDASNLMYSFYMLCMNREPTQHVFNMIHALNVHSLQKILLDEQSVHTYYQYSASNLKFIYDNNTDALSNYILNHSNNLHNSVLNNLYETSSYVHETSNQIVQNLDIIQANYKSSLYNDSNSLLNYMQYLGTSNMVFNIQNMNSKSSIILDTNINSTLLLNSSILQQLVNTNLDVIMNNLQISSNSMLIAVDNEYSSLQTNLDDNSSIFQSFLNNRISNISNYADDTFDNLSTHLHSTSVIVGSKLIDLDNYMHSLLYDVDAYSNLYRLFTSNVIMQNSNKSIEDIESFLSSNIAYKNDVSFMLNNNLNNLVNSLNTNDVDEGSNLYYTYNLFMNSINTKSLDDIAYGTSNSVIINDIYNSNFIVDGNLTTSNLIVFGKESIFNTSVYNTERVEILNASNITTVTIENFVSIPADVVNLNNENANILKLKNDGTIGIKNADPHHNLDVNGVLKASYLCGHGNTLMNINLSDRTTANIKEGSSNLYFLPSRVDYILSSSNSITSNHIDEQRHILNDILTTNDLYNSNLFSNVSNLIITHITEDIINNSNTIRSSSNNLFLHADAQHKNQSNYVSYIQNHVNTYMSNVYIIPGVHNQSNVVLNNNNHIHNVLNTQNLISSNYTCNISMTILNSILSYNTNQSNLTLQNSNIIARTIYNILYNHSNFIQNVSNIFVNNMDDNMSNMILHSSNLLISGIKNSATYHSNMMNNFSNEIVNFTRVNVSNLLISYQAGDIFTYNYTYDPNILHINFRDKKILNTLNTDAYKIKYGTSNIQNIYPVINNFTYLNNIPNYLSTNQYAFTSTSNQYIFMNNEYEIKKLMNAFDGKKFSFHFLFKAHQATGDISIYSLAKNDYQYINIKIINNLLYVVVGTNTFCANTTSISSSTWYTVDIIWNITKGEYNNMMMQIFINLVEQNVYYANTMTSAVIQNVPYNDIFFYEKGNSIIMNLGPFNSDDTIMIQDFRICPYNNIQNISNLYYGINQNEYTVTSNVVIKPVRWLESSSYESNYFNPFYRYISLSNFAVGIGKSSPPEATIDIYTDDPSMYSIKTNNPIWVQSAVLASSDRRIKTNVRPIENENALHQILAIQPKQYDYIDRSIQQVYGFSAQQIKQVIPNAVSLHEGNIPSINRYAILQNNTVYLSDHKLLPNDVIIIHINDNIHFENILKIVNDNSFIIENKSNICRKNIYIYGTVVKDFHALDKNYIFTLSVCATQFIHMKQSQLHSNIAKLVNSNLLQDRYVSKMETLLEKEVNLLTDMNHLNDLVTKNRTNIDYIHSSLKNINNNLEYYSEQEVLCSSNYAYNIIQQSNDIGSKTDNAILISSNILSNTINWDIDAILSNIDNIQNILKNNNVV